MKNTAMWSVFLGWGSPKKPDSDAAGVILWSSGASNAVISERL